MLPSLLDLKRLVSFSFIRMIVWPLISYSGSKKTIIAKIIPALMKQWTKYM